MLAIAGAVLINAACVLIASGRDTTDVYALSRVLIAVGAGLMGADFVGRFREFVKRSRREHESARSTAEPGAAADRGRM
jgi:hypothetical protein